MTWLYDPYRCNPARLAYRSKQRRCNGIFHAVERGLARLSLLREMLLSNITLQTLPLLGSIPHLHKESGFEAPRLMVRIEGIIPQLAWVDSGLLWVGDAFRHNGIIPSKYLREQENVQREVWLVADLKALLAEMERVVQDTMQPEHVSVWLRQR